MIYFPRLVVFDDAAQVLETKKRLQTELSELNKANAERSRELKRKSGKELPAKSNREVMANTLKPLREAGRTNSKEDEPESAHAAEEKEKIGSHLEDIEAEASWAYTCEMSGVPVSQGPFDSHEIVCFTCTQCGTQALSVL